MVRFKVKIGGGGVREVRWAGDRIPNPVLVPLDGMTPFSLCFPHFLLILGNALKMRVQPIFSSHWRWLCCQWTGIGGGQCWWRIRYQEDCRCCFLAVNPGSSHAHCLYSVARGSLKCKYCSRTSCFESCKIFWSSLTVKHKYWNRKQVQLWDCWLNWFAIVYFLFKAISGLHSY